MRNRGIELFLPDTTLDPITTASNPSHALQTTEAAAVTSDNAALVLTQPSGLLEPSNDLELLLASEGVPGAALRAGMAAAHLAVARHAAEYHRCLHWRLNYSFPSSCCLMTSRCCWTRARSGGIQTYHDTGGMDQGDVLW